MSDQKEIRWLQRFNNYKQALAQLSKFIQKGDLNELEEQGLIQAFEYTFELAWNVMKDYYEYQGEERMQGSRDVIRLAFKRGLIEDGDGWMKMVDSRIKTSHTYNEEIASEIADAVFNKYYDLFVLLKKEMEGLQE